MSFRRPKEDARIERRWHAFVSEQRALFAEAGLPGGLSDRRSFDYFLMHAWVADGSQFSLDDLDAEQRGALGRLTAAYVTEFGDPGLDPALARLT